MSGCLCQEIVARLFCLVLVTQVCTIAMVMGDLDLETVHLLPGRLWMKENVDMTLFVISKWSLEHVNMTNPEEGIMVKIVLKRKLMNELMTTYLPSILLIMITYATTFFKPFFFEAALSVNLTTMLVMTTIFIGVMQMLPSTAYVKMIDIWLIFGQLVPFTEVILLTIMEFYREGDGSGEAPDSGEAPGSGEMMRRNTQSINHHGKTRVIDLDLYKNEESDEETKTNQSKQEESKSEAKLKPKPKTNMLNRLKFLGE